MNDGCHVCTDGGVNYRLLIGELLCYVTELKLPAVTQFLYY